MNLWLILSINSVTLGGLLFLLSAGFSLIFGLMRIPNLTHGGMFMLGAYFGVTLIGWGLGFWLSALVAGLGVALFGGIVEGFPCCAASSATNWRRSWSRWACRSWWPMCA